MSARCVLVILVGCTLACCATQHQSTCTCHDQLQTVCIAAGADVTVPCPDWTGEDMKFNLFRGQDVIHNHTCNRKIKAPSSGLLYAGAGVELHENPANKTVGFRLTGVNASSHGLYRCEGISLYPPPSQRVQSHFTILVLVEGEQCKLNKDWSCPETGHDHKWIWILALVSLVLYSVIITIVACVNWVKLRRADCHSDYMNTKPKAARDRRKKGGLRNPIPRYF